MPTINQLVRKPRKSKVEKSKENLLTASLILSETLKVFLYAFNFIKLFFIWSLSISVFLIIGKVKKVNIRINPKIPIVKKQKAHKIKSVRFSICFLRTVDQLCFVCRH